MVIKQEVTQSDMNYLLLVIPKDEKIDHLYHQVIEEKSDFQVLFMNQ